MLLSLSTEVLLLILNFLPNNSLLVLVQVSQRLHDLSIPIYLSRFGIIYNLEDPISLNLHDRSVAALTALCLSSITKVESLSCSFDGPSGVRFSRSVVHLLNFVQGLSEVHSAKLDLRTVDARSADDFITPRATIWIPDFQRLLGAILERGCSSLTIINGYLAAYLEDGPMLSEKLAQYDSKSTRWKSYQTPVAHAATRSFLKFALPSIRRDSKVERLPSSYDLTTLDVGSSVMFSPQLYDWTLNILNTCKITCLSFRLSGFPSQAWKRILSSVTIPTLQEFVLEVVNVDFPDLVEFLLRHPSITHLNLHPYVVCPTQHRLRTKERILPHLAALGGSPNNITAFLEYLSPDFKPQLRLRSILLTLPVHQRVLLPSDIETFSQRVGQIVQRVKPTSVSLKFSIPHFETLSASAATARDRPANTSLITALHTVEVLTLSSDGFFAFQQWVVPVFPDWLVNFVSLKHIEFARDCFPEETDHRASFVASIRKACPNIVTISCGEDLYFASTETYLGPS